MDEDDLVRTTVITVFLVGIVAWLLGGFLTSVAGIWAAGERNVTLTQVGPWVWGDSTWSEGRQIYRGWVFFGRLRLTRYDFGAAHLATLGFSAEQTGALEGVSTGHFVLRRDGSRKLRGQFHGRKFSFEGDKVQGVTHVSPNDRVWERAGAGWP
jgi:hypothetical protein